MLGNLTINGRARKVIMQANKNGFYYVLDRLTGQFISAGPYARINWSQGIDQRTGRPLVNPGALYGTESVTISPGAGGAHNWSPMSFHPGTGLTYIPTTSFSSSTHAAEATFNPTAARSTGTVRGAPPPTTPPLPAIGPEPIEGPGGRGALVAWDPVAQRSAGGNPASNPGRFARNPTSLLGLNTPLDGRAARRRALCAVRRRARRGQPSGAYGATGKRAPWAQLTELPAGTRRW